MLNNNKNTPSPSSSSLGYDLLTDMAESIYKNNVDKGFWDVHNDVRFGPDVNDEKEKEVVKSFRARAFMLIVSEIAEALEHDRQDSKDDKLPEYDGVDVELADALIRILDFCGAYKIDIGTIVQKKLEYNRQRPYKHGKTF